LLNDPEILVVLKGRIATCSLEAGIYD